MQVGKEQKNILLPDEHIYHPLLRNAIPVNAISLLVIFGTQAGFAVYYMLTFHKPPYQYGNIGFTIGFNILGFLIWLSWLNWALKLFRKLRLVTSPQGIIFYGLGYSIYTPWLNLVGRGKMSRKNMLVSPLPTRNVEGLQFEPVTTPMRLAQAIEQHRPAIEETGKNTGLYRFARVDMMPIGYFLHDWQRSPLAQEIRRYAPQVFPAPS
ncbi:MAG TPA: hypothetical protein VF043_27190 [Ktedonobacteraceae bacterium]